MHGKLSLIGFIKQINLSFTLMITYHVTLQMLKQKYIQNYFAIEMYRKLFCYRNVLDIITGKIN